MIDLRKGAAQGNRVRSRSVYNCNAVFKTSSKKTMGTSKKPWRKYVVTDSTPALSQRLLTFCKLRPRKLSGGAFFSTAELSIPTAGSYRNDDNLCSLKCSKIGSIPDSMR
jgi:hypothetical protein